MEYNREPSGLSKRPNQSVDTGMGLERIAATMLNLQDPSKNSNYETDLFFPLIRRAGQLLEVDLQIGLSQVPSLRIIADHARATTFLITDGILPANDGRGYVLRKIMRRAIRHGRLLGAEKPFLADMVLAVRDLMGKADPELLEPSAARVPEIVLAEEKRFAHTIDKGLKEWDATRKRFADDFRLSLTRQLHKEFPGEEKNIDRAFLG